MKACICNCGKDGISEKIIRRNTGKMKKYNKILINLYALMYMDGWKQKDAKKIKHRGKKGEMENIT